MNIMKNSNKEYHEGEGISKSDLDLLHACPAKYIYAKEHREEREETPALLFGSAVHKLILEPEGFDKEFAVAPECNRRTTEGKQEYSKFLGSVGDRRIISRQDYDNALEMRNAVMLNPKAAKLLTNGETEASYYWTDIRTGTLCKCRPDKVNINYLIDLKTTSDASPEAFSKAIYNYRYHVQAAWYMRGYEAATGIKPEGFVFVAVEKTPPYAVALYVVDDITLDIGAKEADSDLDIYCECSRSGNWYGYGGEREEVMTLSLPLWAVKNYEV